MSVEGLTERIRAIENKKKSWIDVAAVPIAIALTGSVSTWFVTRAQIVSAEKIAESTTRNSKVQSVSQLELQTKTAEGQQSLKALELCIKYITDGEPHTRERGVLLLGLLAPDLAAKIRDQLLAQEKDPAVRDAAKKLEIHAWFPVVASPTDRSDAIARATKLNLRSYGFAAEVYEGPVDAAGRPIYPVTLGGFLPASEADDRVAYAKKEGIAADAYSTRNKTSWQKIF